MKPLLKSLKLKDIENHLKNIELTKAFGFFGWYPLIIKCLFCGGFYEKDNKKNSKYWQVLKTREVLMRT